MFTFVNMEVDHGSCPGLVIGDDVLSRAHNYVDGRKHESYSDSICPDCLDKRREYLNGKKKREFTEEDINGLERLTDMMYGKGKWE